MFEVKAIITSLDTEALMMITIYDGSVSNEAVV